jgi:hypothetical protein
MKEATVTVETIAPHAERATIPADYGVSKTSTALVSWEHVEDRLRRDRVYWIATLSPTGLPRVRPVDGVYVDGVIYVGGSPATRWVSDLVSHAAVSIHLADVTDVVVVEGEAETLNGLPPDLAARVAAASNEKFPEYGMTAESYRGPGPIAIRPRKVLAWTDFGNDPTRFTFPR